MKGFIPVLLTALVALAPAASAQSSLLVYNGSSFSPSSQATGLSGGLLTVTPGTDLTGFGISGGEYSADNWTTANSASTDSAFVFTVTAGTGYTVNLTSLSFDYKAQGSGPDQVSAAYDPPSGPGSRSAFGSPETTGAYALFLTHGDPGASTYNAPGDYFQSGSLMINAGETYTFYLLGYDAHNAGKSLAMDNITLSGSVSAVPESGTYALLLGAVALAGVVIRRGRRNHA